MKLLYINRALDEIFNHCIELMHQGHNIEDCLKLYEANRNQLLPLLKATRISMNAAKSINSNENAKNVSKVRFLATLSKTESASASSSKIRMDWLSPNRLLQLVKSFFTQRGLDEIFNHCIELMHQGHNIEDCLKLYGANRNQLIPLLEATRIPMTVAKSINSNENAKNVSKMRFLAALSKTESASASSSKAPMSFTRNLFRPIALPMTAIMLLSLLILGVGSIAAIYSEDSIPGDNNYWIKRTKENILLAISGSDAERAQVHAELASTRGEELYRLIEQGRLATAEGHLDSVFQHLDASAEHAGVSVTLNTIDTPATKISIETDRQLGLLTVTLNQGREVLSLQNIPLATKETTNHLSRVDQIRYEFELAFRILLWALENNQQSQPFWVNQNLSHK